MGTESISATAQHMLRNMLHLVRNKQCTHPLKGVCICCTCCTSIR